MRRRLRGTRRTWQGGDRSVLDPVGKAIFRSRTDGSCTIRIEAFHSAPVTRYGLANDVARRTLGRRRRGAHSVRHLEEPGRAAESKTQSGRLQPGTRVGATRRVEFKRIVAKNFLRNREPPWTPKNPLQL